MVVFRGTWYEGSDDGGSYGVAHKHAIDEHQYPPRQVDRLLLACALVLRVWRVLALRWRQLRRQERRGHALRRCVRGQLGR
jgi:hypothetical protein